MNKELPFPWLLYISLSQLKSNGKTQSLGTFMGFVAISDESQPDGMRNSSYPAVPISMTHVQSCSINQPSRTLQKL